MGHAGEVAVRVNEVYYVRVMVMVMIRVKDKVSVLGVLNDYRTFDYRIRSSFSFSFVSHSILEIFRAS